MKKTLTFMFTLAVLLNAAGCNRSAPPAGPQALPTLQPPLAATPLPTATPTLPPTATPIPEARVQTGDRALFQGDWETALVEYDKALTGSPDTEIQAAALLGMARSQWMARNTYETGRLLERLLQEYPFSVQRAAAYFLLAQLQTEQDRYVEAADAYTHYLELNPGAIDAYILDLRGDANFAAANYPAAAKDFESALASGSRLDSTTARLKMARAYALAGDSPTALLLYDDLYQRVDVEDTRALIDVRKGEIYTQLGQTAEAQAAYMDAVQNFPTSYNAYTALVALVDAGVEVDELRRGLIDYYAGQYGVAQAAFDRYLQNKPADPGTALYFLGMAQHKLGTYQAAIEKWDALIQDYPDNTYWDDAWEQKAYTQWAFLDQYQEAIDTLLGFVEASPQHARAGEFLFDAGLVAERDGQLDKAAEYWDRVAREYPHDERAGRALFLMGIAYYRLEDYRNASDCFQRQMAITTVPAERAANQMWIGKCHQALGDEAAAKAAWEKAAEIDPTGYYSERAKDLMYHRPAFEPPLSVDLDYDLGSERRRAEDWMRTSFALPADANLSGLGPLAEHAGLKRGAELWRLGLPDEARLEFEQARQEFSADPVLTFRLANYLVELGAYRPAIMAGRQVLELAGMGDADTFAAPIFFNHLRFGTYYRDLIQPLAEQYDFHPLLLFSVVRQESLFEGFVRSSAGAHGLMQIIPSTGEDIAADLGWPENYADEDLARPIVNVTFGVDYLHTQREAFNGDMYAALAAYNGGAGNSLIWLEEAKGDPDLFLEVIRYAETRDYIRGVYELFSIYRLLYDREL